MENRRHACVVVMSLRIGVIGPSRRRNGTGEFVSRFLSEAGAEIVAVASSSEFTAAQAAQRLSAQYGISARPARNVREMLEKHALDGLAICSPAECHTDHLSLALEAGLHVFCEKPLIANIREPALPKAKTLVEGFAASRRVLYMNTPWIHTLSGFESLYGKLGRVDSFYMMLCPPYPGINIFIDAMPHPISMLTAFGATGEAVNIDFEWSSSFEHLGLTFSANRARTDPISVSCVFSVMQQQPRSAAYEINRHRVERHVDMATYSVSLRDGQRSISIADPLRCSVRNFITCLRDCNYELEANRILANVRMLDDLAALVLSPLVQSHDSRNS